MPGGILVAVLLLLLAAPSSAFAKDATDVPTPAQLRACILDPTPEACLDALFRRYLTRYPTQDALRLLEKYQAADGDIRNACHPVVHAIGRETFRVQRSVQSSFQVCDGTCHSGCYHGVIERFLGGIDGGHVSQDDLKRRAADVCPGAPDSYLHFQCVHGLGHGVLFFSGYRLDEALGVCDSLRTEKDQRSCYGGVFMENLAAASQDRRDVHPTDYHYPCSRLGPRYRGDCYLMQTSRMIDMGLFTGRLFEECAKAGPHRRQCMTSIGRDLSNHSRVDGPEWVAAQCEWHPADDRRSCIRGVVVALIDNTWDLRYALPFCAALKAGEDRGYCVNMSARYVVRNHDVTPEAITEQCRQHFPHGTMCRAVAQATRKPPARHPHYFPRD